MNPSDAPKEEEEEESIGSPVVGYPSHHSRAAFIIKTPTDATNDQPHPFYAMTSTIMTTTSMNLTRHRTTRNHRVLHTFGIACICYFSSCGGPIGSEPVIAAGGPVLGLIGLIVYPLVCTLPFVFVITELCTAFPEDGGFSVWVLNAFGPFWGFQEGYWSWIAGILNRAIYPGLVYGIVAQTIGEFQSAWTIYFFKAAIAILLALPCLLGVKIVARMTMFLLACVLIPFIIFSIWGFIKVADTNTNSTNAFESTKGHHEINWSLLINTLFWNYDGLYLASVFGGEISNPARSYPHGILIALGLTVATYLIPILAAMLFNQPDWSAWEESSYPMIAQEIGGQFLYGLILFSSLSSLFGMYMAELFCEAFQVCGMAQYKLIPSVFKHRNRRFDTPHNAIFFSLLLILVLIGLDFEVILGMTNAFAAAVKVMIILSVIQLRRKLPYIVRPMRFPGNELTLGITMFLPSLLLAYIIVRVFQDWFSAILVTCLVLLGFGYGLSQKKEQEKDLQLQLVIENNNY